MLFSALRSVRHHAHWHYGSNRNIATSTDLLRRQPKFRVSKTITWLLRHGGKNEGIDMRTDGFVRVQDLLRHPALRGLDFMQLEDLVQTDKKGRFSMSLDRDGSESNWLIRANQGHSIADVTLDLTPILSADQVPMAVHGTTQAAWKFISTQGLSRMGRQHIHFATDLPRLKPRSGISGLRPTSEILIFLNLPLALSAGYKFFLSANNVVLSPGNDFGILPPSLFQQVTQVVDKHYWRMETKPVKWCPPSIDPTS